MVIIVAFGYKERFTDYSFQASSAITYLTRMERYEQKSYTIISKNIL